MTRLLPSLLILTVLGCGGAEPSSRTSAGSKPSGVKQPMPPERSPAEVIVQRLDGTAFAPLTEPGDDKTQVFVFLTTDCPIANRYAPTLQRIAKRCSQDGVAFTLVYPNRSDSAEKIRKHLADYGHECEAVRDIDHSLVARTGATVTPEAAVFDAGGDLAYCGRIDDWYVDFGKNRREPTAHDLEDAITAVLDGASVREARTRAVGCYIPDRTDSRTEPRQ